MDETVKISENVVEVVTVDDGMAVAVTRDVVTVVEIGIPGPPGPGAAFYDFTQASPAMTWTINHNLGYRPQVELRTVGGQVMLAEITHVSVNQVQVSFVVAIAGTARLA